MRGRERKPTYKKNIYFRKSTKKIKVQHFKPQKFSVFSLIYFQIDQSLFHTSVKEETPALTYITILQKKNIYLTADRKSEKLSVD